MESIVKSIIWFVVSTAVELVAAFIVAGLAMLWLHFASIPTLAALGYWNLYWLQMAVYEAVGSAVVMGVLTKEFLQS